MPMHCPKKKVVSSLVPPDMPRFLQIAEGYKVWWSGAGPHSLSNKYCLRYPNQVIRICEIVAKHYQDFWYPEGEDDFNFFQASEWKCPDMNADPEYIPRCFFPPFSDAEVKWITECWHAALAEIIEYECIAQEEEIRAYLEGQAQCEPA